MRALVAALLLGSVCGAACSQQSVGTRSNQRLYTVTAPMFASVTNSDAQACYFVEFSEPPQCGAGVAVDGVNVEAIPGAQAGRFSIFTPSVRLVGTWNGTRLSLRSPPVLASVTGASPARCTDAEVSPDGTAAAARLDQDLPAIANQGIVVLETGQCDPRHLYVTVAVADASTTSYLRQHYGPLTVNGWLSPTS